MAVFAPVRDFGGTDPDGWAHERGLLTAAAAGCLLTGYALVDDAGRVETLDARARRACEVRIAHLTEQIEAAESNGASEQLIMLRQELSELRAAFALDVEPKRAWPRAGGAWNMNWNVRAFALALCASCAAQGCGASSPEAAPTAMVPGRDAAGPEADSASGSGGDDGSAASARDADAQPFLPDVIDCEGTGALLVAHRYQTTGNVPWGASLDLELGVPALFLDDRCRLYLIHDPRLEIRTQQLTPAATRAMLEQLKADEWPSLAGWYCRFIFDGSYVTLWSRWAELQVQPFQWPGCTQVSSQVRSVEDALYAFISEQDRAGDPLTGPVRYTLVFAGARDIDANYKNAAPWPLDNVDSLLAALDGVSQVPIWAADGAAAQTLRALRRRHLEGELGDPAIGFIPIRQPDGTLLELRIRDVIPLEDATTAQVVIPFTKAFLDQGPR